MVRWRTYETACPLSHDMKHQIGMLMQLMVLALLPALIIWQLTYGIRLVVMPTMTLVGIVIFYIGTRLREGK